MYSKYIYFIILIILFSCEKEHISTTQSVSADSLIQQILPFNSDSLYVKTKIKRNDTFARIMDGHVAYLNILKLFKDSKKTNFSLNRLRKGQDYRIIYRDSLFYKFEYEIDSRGYYEILRTDSNEYKSGVVMYEFDKDTLYAEGTITSNLYTTMQENNYPMLLAFELANVFAWDFDFSNDLRKNDSFKVYYESLSRNGDFVGVGKVIATEFINNHKKYSAFHYQYPDKNKFDYFSFDKRNTKKAFLKAPVEYSRISGTFGGRFHPIQRRYKSHNGTDYVASKNTPVMAVADGKIVERGRNKFNGNYLKIKFHGGFSAFYLHLNGFNRKFKKWSNVKQGDVVGYVGKTGMATGHHLCFQFRKSNQPSNFQRVKNPETASLDSIYYIDFENKLSEFQF